MYMPTDYGVMSMQIEGQHIKLNIPYIHMPYSHSPVAIQEICTSTLSSQVSSSLPSPSLRALLCLSGPIPFFL